MSCSWPDVVRKYIILTISLIRESISSSRSSMLRKLDISGLRGFKTDQFAKILVCLHCLRCPFPRAAVHRG